MGLTMLRRERTKTCPHAMEGGAPIVFLIDLNFRALVFLLALSCLAITACDSSVSKAPTQTGADAEDSLKTIKNPGGGQVIYGPVAGQSTLQGAMATMLRQVHGHFGDRPQIGKFFQSRSGESVATFFSLTAKNQGGTRIAGLVIVSMPGGAKPAAAVLYDDADRFGKTENVLMNKLNEAWHKEKDLYASQPQPVQSPAQGGAPLPLHRTRFADNSGTIDLPAGWKITNAGGGTVHAAGPRGESIHMGVIIGNIYDPKISQSRQMIQYMKQTHKPYFSCSFNGDLVGLYRCVTQQDHQRRRAPVPTLTVTSEDKERPDQYHVASSLVKGDLDSHDGTGLLRFSMRLGAMRGGGAGAWSLTVSGVSVPKQLWDEELATVKAIAASYNQNAQVINQQTAVVIDNIHAVGEASKRASVAANAASDARIAAFNTHMDDLSRSSKVFENYQLDRTVIQDNDNSTRGTTGYALGETLVKGNPNRFEYVPNQNLLKGVDY